jgi:ABC-type branched-subunit amino acid transport system substrate-binding protein
MKHSQFILGRGAMMAHRLARCAQQAAVSRLVWALGVEASGSIAGERRRGVVRRLVGCLLVSGAMAMSAAAENAPGVTDREIKIGQTMPYAGPVAWISSIGVAEKAYIQMINDQGGEHGLRCVDRRDPAAVRGAGAPQSPRSRLEADLLHE